jgi:tetratricopeptide (TPR) repeat protein
MANPMLESSDDPRIGTAIAEYLVAVDSQQPLDIDAWLNRHAEIRVSLEAFLADQAHWRRWTDGDDSVVASSRIDLPNAGSTEDLMSAAEASTLRESPGPDVAGVIGGGTLGPYQLLSELGRGGMGQVFAARHQELGRLVALKVLAAGDLADEDERRRFRREAEAVAKLDHPNIVPIFEVGQQQGWDYFTMKLLPGGSLRDWMSETAEVPLRQIAQGAAQLASALQHAHQRGILHRDLKPGNILLDEQQRPCLVDFGLAKHLSHDQTTLGPVLGTPAFMAPEQMAGETTTLSDVYSLGATLYALLAKRLPFQGKSLPELAEQIRAQAPMPLRAVRPDVPRDLEVICLKCLEKSPDQRYASAADVAADLQRWLRGEAILARPVAWHTQAWLWCRRHPLVSGLAATLAVVVIGSTIVLSLLLEQARRMGREAERHAQQALANAQVADVNAEAAIAAAAEATQQRDRARQVLDVMTSTMAYEWLAGQQPLTKSQQSFLRQNVDYYRELLSEATDAVDPDQLWWLGQVQHRLSAMLGRLGERDEAVQLAENAAETLRRIPTDWQPLPVLLLRSQVLHDLQTWLADTAEVQRSLAVMEQAKDVLRSVVALDPANREAATRSGQLLVDLGTRYRFLGKIPQAVQTLEDAVDWNTQLLAQQPNLPGAKRQLGISLRTLGLAQMQASDFAAAERSMTAALELQRQVAEQAPQEWRFQSDIAYTLDNLGIVKDHQGDLQQAANLISQALAQRRQILQVLPGEETLHRALVQSALNLASILKRQAEWPTHRETLERTLEQIDLAMARFPAIAEYRYWEWVAKLGLAENHNQQGEQESAMALLTEVMPLLQTAPQNVNSQRILRNQLLRAWNLRATIHSDQGEHEAALADWQSCIDQTSGLEQANHRLCQAVAHFKAGQWERATDIVGAFLAMPADDPAHPLWPTLHYNLARAQALIAQQQSDAATRADW